MVASSSSREALPSLAGWFGRALRLLALEHDQHLFIRFVGGESGRAILRLATVLVTRNIS
jgi:hypothetical protein